jgi:hypothetical protein
MNDGTYSSLRTGGISFFAVVLVDSFITVCLIKGSYLKQTNPLDYVATELVLTCV